MYFTGGIRFQKLEDILKIYKRKNMSLEAVLSFFSSASNREKVAKMYPTIEPLSVKEAISFENTEQRMFAIRLFSPQDLVKELKAKIVDKQTIRKKQIRWNEQLKPYEYEYEDTYTLYEINGKNFFPSQQNPIVNIRIRSNNVYVVECKCASTNRVYFLYVPESVGRQKDAIEAIAWTMQINGKPISKEQYLHLMYSET